MKQELLRFLQCPYCQEDFIPGEVCRQEGGEVLYGDVKCACGRHPVVGGILSLRRGFAERKALQLMDRDKPEDALALLLAPGGGYLSRLGLSLGLALSRSSTGQYVKEGLSLCEVLGNSSYDVYLKHRFSAESLWSLCALLPLLQERKGAFLDLCCGVGHSSFLLSRYVQPRELVSADGAFHRLHLARKFMAPSAHFLCLNANQPLPFKKAAFNVAMVLDALHYLRSPARVVRELEGLLLPDGLLLLLHLHNSLQFNRAPGKPLPPASWSRMLERFSFRALPERRLVENFLFRDELDLSGEHTEEELDSSPAIDLVSGGGEGDFRLYPEASRGYFAKREKLVVNPAYEIKQEGESLLLKRVFPQGAFQREFPLASSHLPESYRTERGLLKEVGGREVSQEFIQAQGKAVQEMMGRFILLNVPQGYC